MYTKCGTYLEAAGHCGTPPPTHPSPLPPLHLLSPPSNGIPPSKYISVAAQAVYIGVHKDTGKPIPMVARVSLIDYRGDVVLDTFVRPTHVITDYRSAETGLQFHHLSSAPSFDDVQHRVYCLIKNKIIVGHSLWLFLSILGLKHPAINTRDLALFLPLRRRLKSETLISLNSLVRNFMGRSIGIDYEETLEVARAGIDLFRSCEEIFEEVVYSGAWPCDLPPETYAEYFT